MFELATVQSLLIWAIAEAILTCGWLLLQHRLPQRWYSLIQLVRLSAIPYFALISGQISVDRYPRDRGGKLSGGRSSF